MINEECGILKRGKGFCWCPSEAWNVDDDKLCQLCQVKNAEKTKKLEFVLLNKAQAPTGKKGKDAFYKVAAAVH